MSVNPASPSFQLFGDSTQSVNYRRDSYNYITQLFSEQMPTIHTGLFNVHLNQGLIVQPHWHTNVNELVFVISGEIMTSVFNPFTQSIMTYHVKPGQASQFPKGWFHWIVALRNNTHFLTIFDQPKPDIVFGSDFLRFLPKEIANRAYCINKAAYAHAIAPITQSTILGPPPGCDQIGGALNYPYQATQPSPTIHPYLNLSSPPHAY